MKELSAPNYEHYSIKLSFLLDTVSFKIKHGDGKAAEIKIREMLKTTSLPYEHVRDVLFHNIEIISYISKKKGWDLVVALQPTLYSTEKKLTPYEEKLVQLYLQRYIGIGEYNRDAYERLRNDLPKFLKSKDIAYLDVDDAIKGEEKTVFYDHAHFGDRGHRLIGGFLANKLAPIIDARNKGK